MTNTAEIAEHNGLLARSAGLISLWQSASRSRSTIAPNVEVFGWIAASWTRSSSAAQPRHRMVGEPRRGGAPSIRILRRDISKNAMARNTEGMAVMAAGMNRFSAGCSTRKNETGCGYPYCTSSDHRERFAEEIGPLSASSVPWKLQASRTNAEHLRTQASVQSGG